ncbi:MAG: RDD family protein [Planctomycetes bacterium]|nr:RDD family protein [Planctomycetota bacterium]
MSPERKSFDRRRVFGDESRMTELRTPEGVGLHFRIATMSSRMGAFTIDLALIVVVNLLLLIGLAMTLDLLGFALFMVLWFLSVNFYFPFCEYRWGATLGKRVLGVRVIDRRGAPLSLEAILARNFLRDLEFWVPFLVLCTGGQIFADSPSPGYFLLALLWLFAMLVFPAFSRRRLRLGDYAGGTMVVEAPRPQLSKDLAQKRTDEEIHFTAEQLALYGKLELQVLEDLLRRPYHEVKPMMGKVARRIRKRIAWSSEGRKVSPRAFLEAFYQAQREELERLMVLGKGREERERRPARERPGTDDGNRPADRT